MRRAILTMITMVAALLLSACGGGGSGGASGSGEVALYMTDAPLLEENVTGVYVTIEEVMVKSDGNWRTLEGFEGPKTVNLLTLQNGERIKLAEATLPEGEYKLRFDLDAKRCSIAFKNDSNVPLKVPSGKIEVQGSVLVTEGKIEAIVDFDLHKSVIRTGYGYLLKPFLRVCGDARSGDIEGKVTNISDYNASLERLLVFAYRSGSYEEEESLSDEENLRFKKAVASAKVDMKTGSFSFHYLPKGIYDLAIVRYVDYDFGEVLGLRCGVKVHRGVTEVTIDTTDLEVECKGMGECEGMDDIKTVALHVVGIRYKLDEDSWYEAQDFNGSAIYDLLDLASEKGMVLAGVTLPAGHYTQIRLILKEKVDGEQGLHFNEGSYLRFDDNRTVPLRVPSGEVSGYKLDVDFTLEKEANVTLKSQLNLCRLLHETGNGMWILRPTLKIDEAVGLGRIAGRVVNIGDYNATTDALKIFLYSEDGAKPENELPETGKVVARTDVNMTDGNFTLEGIAEGTYDLGVFKYHEGNLSGLATLVRGVEVEAGETATLEINTSNSGS